MRARIRVVRWQGALAHLSAYELATAHRGTACRLVTFGSFRPGNATFAKALDSLANLTAWRVQNELDLASMGWTRPGYAHSGTHVWLCAGRVCVAGARGEGPEAAHSLVTQARALSIWPRHHLLATADGYLAHLSSYTWPSVDEACCRCAASPADEHQDQSRSPDRGRAGEQDGAPIPNTVRHLWNAVRASLSLRERSAAD